MTITILVIVGLCLYYLIIDLYKLIKFMWVENIKLTIYIFSILFFVIFWLLKKYVLIFTSFFSDYRFFN